jgi:DNA mismatch repair protein PMS2
LTQSKLIKDMPIVRPDSDDDEEMEIAVSDNLPSTTSEAAQRSLSPEAPEDHESSRGASPEFSLFKRKRAVSVTLTQGANVSVTQPAERAEAVLMPEANVIVHHYEMPTREVRRSPIEDHISEIHSQSSPLDPDGIVSPQIPRNKPLSHPTPSPVATPAKRVRREVLDRGFMFDTPGTSINHPGRLRINKKLPDAVNRLRSFAAPGSQVQRETSAGRAVSQRRTVEENDEGSSGSDQIEEESADEEEDEEEELAQPGSALRRSQRERLLEDSESESDPEEDIIVTKSLGNDGSAQHSEQEHGESDSDYVDDETKKRAEDRRVEALISAAENDLLSTKTDIDLETYAKRALRGPVKDTGSSTVHLSQTLNLEPSDIESLFLSHSQTLKSIEQPDEDIEEGQTGTELDDLVDDVSRLELTISKPDFGLMRIVGQFNNGFILTTRTHPNNKSKSKSRSAKRTPLENLFIIDQHASAEKTTFERLSDSLVLDSQPLVHPLRLSLTAVEEEIVLSSLGVLKANGFIVSVDTSGDYPVGSRIELRALPVAKGSTFTADDLSELIALISESPPSYAASQGQSNPDSTRNDITIPRPSKVRKILASRACRSSVMIGTALSGRQMEKIVKGLGGLDKPWNCPHGRPTMRHLAVLDGWKGWDGDEDEI